MNVEAADLKSENWGDLGYAKTAPEVESIPNSAVEDSIQKESAFNTVEGDDAIVKAKPISAPEPINNVSTVQNTYGVETVENPPIRVYISPFAGMSSSFGNTTVDLSPSYAAGGSVGILLNAYTTIEASFIHSEQGVSAIRSSYTSINYPIIGDVYSLKQNQFDLGVKLFFLGRESKFRPFFGGGFGYIKNSFNYQATYAQSAANQGYGIQDFQMNQVTGFGEIGIEFAFTKMIVANAMLKVDGVMSSNSSYDDSGKPVDLNKITAGNSLSHAASYTLGAGLGIYF